MENDPRLDNALKSLTAYIDKHGLTRDEVELGLIFAVLVNFVRMLKMRAAYDGKVWATIEELDAIDAYCNKYLLKD